MARNVIIPVVWWWCGVFFTLNLTTLENCFSLFKVVAISASVITYQVYFILRPGVSVTKLRVYRVALLNIISTLYFHFHSHSIYLIFNGVGVQIKK